MITLLLPLPAPVQVLQAESRRLCQPQRALLRLLQRSRVSLPVATHGMLLSQGKDAMMLPRLPASPWTSFTSGIPHLVVSYLPAKSGQKAEY